MLKQSIGIALTLLVLSGCVREQQVVVVQSTAVNSTPAIETGLDSLGIIPILVTPTIPPFPTPLPTAESAPIQVTALLSSSREYVVQPGDTLSGIAVANGISLEILLSVNPLANPDILSVGQILRLPDPPGETTPPERIFADNTVVRGPGANAFDISAFISAQPGYIRAASDTVEDQVLTADQVITRVSMEFSVDPRFLLALLEFRSGWLSTTPVDNNRLTYPIQQAPSADGFDRTGLYRQLAWAANQVNRGYYNWKYGNLSTLELPDSTRFLINPALNAGTVGVQYLLSLLFNLPEWLPAVSNSASSLYQTYRAFFGAPDTAAETLVPPDLVQPILTLPFQRNEVWFFTGGPHGGWGSGSAWAAIDFAPPDERNDADPLCYISQFPARAVASGTIARVDTGTVILDLDGDGNETSGWSILYLHLDATGRITQGSVVSAGDILGYPSCEGGFSNATHLHIARRFNGEWIPADCSACREPFKAPSMNLSDWIVYGYSNQEYQGYLLNGTERRDAEQGRVSPINRVSW